MRPSSSGFAQARFEEGEAWVDTEMPNLMLNDEAEGETDSLEPRAPVLRKPKGKQKPKGGKHPKKTPQPKTKPASKSQAKGAGSATQGGTSPAAQEARSPAAQGAPPPQAQGAQPPATQGAQPPAAQGSQSPAAQEAKPSGKATVKRMTQRGATIYQIRFGTITAQVTTGVYGARAQEVAAILAAMLDNGKTKGEIEEEKARLRTEPWR